MSRDELVEQAMRVHEAAVKDGVGGNVLTMGEVSALIARIRELEAGLRKFGQHPPGCPMFATFGSDDRLCECGLAALAGEA